jgi:hypothetical protein
MLGALKRYGLILRPLSIKELIKLFRIKYEEQITTLNTTREKWNV